MYDAQLVKVSDSLQDLSDHTTGVLLRVVPSVQNTLQELPASQPNGAEQAVSSVGQGALPVKTVISTFLN